MGPFLIITAAVRAASKTDRAADSQLKTNGDANVSICPKGEAFSLPQPGDYEKEFKRLRKLVKQQRSMGREIVVVMGVGFVGAVMAGVVADAVDEATGGRPISSSGCNARRSDRSGRSPTSTGAVRRWKPRTLKWRH